MHGTARLKIVKPLDMDWDQFGALLRKLQGETRRALNRAIQMFWEYDNLSFDFKNKTGTYPTKDDLASWSGYKTINGVAYNVLKADCEVMNTNNLGQAIQYAKKRWSTDKPAINKGDKSVPWFKKNNPVFLHPRNISQPYVTDKGYAVDVALVSKGEAKRMGRTGRIPVALMAGDNSRRVILNRIISGEYSVAGSKIAWHKRKRIWELHLTYAFEDYGGHELLADNVMGVDVGIACPFYLAFSGSLSRYYVGPGEIDAFRRGIDARRRSVLRQGKWCGDGRRGHGRATRLRPADKLKGRVENFKDTTNHKYSRYIVDMAIKHKCAVIQMENLEDIKKHGNEKFLRNWTYYDLRAKVEYKAEREGILVKLVDPQYTSQRCSQCGHIASANRPKKPDQSVFRCVSCGFEENADYNAAKNIATPGIEDIIRQTQRGAAL